MENKPPVYSFFVHCTKSGLGVEANIFELQVTHKNFNTEEGRYDDKPGERVINTVSKEALVKFIEENLTAVESKEQEVH